MRVIGNATQPHPTRAERGFTLLEALVSIAVLGFGFVTTMAFHGELLGSAGENRIRSTAMSLAEARLEALRAEPFDDLAAGSYEETLADLDAFGFLSLRPISLKRCWVIVDEPGLKRVQVAVSRSNDTCAPWTDDALVTLTSRIANNDFARAGSKTLADARFNPDGLGEIVPLADIGDTPYAGDASIPGGFDVLQAGEEYGGGFALCDASSGECLVPDVDDDGNQNFATINGNIFLSDRTCATTGDNISERCGVELVIEGNGLCRLHYPGDSGGSTPPALPAAVGVDAFNYITYTCVVADQWRRSISVLPAETEKVCVGNPALVLLDGDPDDQLRSITRFYDGRQPSEFGDDPHGLKGGPLTGDLQAKVGTVCTSDDDCWSDLASRGLVPGGHHFLVMPSAGGTCSARMEELDLVDEANGSYYTNLFARNPDIFYCTSSKDYEGDFCTTFTRSSGFIANSSSLELTSGDLVILPSRTGLLQACSFFGALGQDGGGYVCGMRHGAQEARIAGISLNETIMFETPDYYFFNGTEDYLPATLPLDATARSFEVADANVAPTAAFTYSCPDLGLTCSFDPSGSNDPDGSIVSYAWDFGDGSSETGAGPGSVSHPYAAAGEYTVTLAVTDNEGAIGLVSQTVLVTAEGANTAPVASFVYECANLACAFDGTGSTDAEGPIATYSWDLGDGTTSSDPVISHVYGSSGAYTVVLIVTDEAGAPGSTSQTINVSEAVVEVRCDIVVTGAKQSNNATVAMSYDGGQFLNCTNIGNKDYRCSRTNALEGVPVELRSTRDGNHPVLGHDFVVNCSSPSTTHDF